MRIDSATTLFLALATALSACKSDEGSTPSASDINSYCTRQCAKMKSCNFILGTEEACVTDCKARANSGSGASTCNPTASEVDLCLTKLEALTCAQLETATPPECDLCPGSTVDGGTKADASVPVACQELSTCCATLPAAAAPTCNGMVASGLGVTCSNALQGYKDNGYCGGTVDSGIDEEDASEPHDAASDAGQPVADTGPAADATTGGGCIALSTCCAAIVDVNIKAGCEGIVNLGDDDTCTSSRDGFVVGGYC
ncbi:MAG: hypothetical protein HYV07_03350 [Deltaproteobacteria bacterium]|nr:hypothetical protein [Deltaproteobacteria bacterium]